MSERVATATGYPLETIQRIMFCESRYGKLGTNDNISKDGTVWSRDWLDFQINDYWHKETALKMGLDIINNREDGATYAIHLLKTEGLEPWRASAYCQRTA